MIPRHHSRYLYSILISKVEATMRYLIALSLFFAPTYAIRFSLFGIPANLLMVWLLFVSLMFIITTTKQHQWHEFWQWVRSLHTTILFSTVLFLFAGLINLFTNGLNQEKLGEFLVLFIQPIAMAIITGFTAYKDLKTKELFISSCYVFLGLCGVLAIIQYFTLYTLPSLYWGNTVEPKRALAMFTHPNFFALFIAPLLAFLVADISLQQTSFKLQLENYKQIKSLIKIIAWVLGIIGLGLSLSRAGWLGLTVAIGIYAVVAADKKIRKLFFVTGAIIILLVAITPNLRYRFLLPFYGEKSAVSRLSLWDTGIKGIKDSPILGLGLHGFSENWGRLNTDPGLDTHNFPHNIFLNFWVETGLLGLLSIFALIGFLIWQGIKNKTDPIKLGLALFLIALITQGLLDNPYFKNDLALVFWVLLALGI